MKYFINQFLLFFLPIFIIGFVLEIILRKIPNDYNYKKTYLDLNSKNIKILILGSSHSYYGINPAFLKENSFNCSHISQSLKYDYKILKKYENRWDNLKIIIIPIDYLSLYTSLETSIESWRIKNYYLYYHINTGLNITNRTEILNRNLKYSINRIYNFYSKNITDISCSKIGWGTNYNSKYKQDLVLSGKDAAYRHLAKDESSFKDNINTVNLIIEFANKFGIKVLFYTNPAYKSYTDILNKNQLNNTIDNIKAISDSKSNTKYFNLLYDTSFTEKDYFDADHLNEIGAQKLSLKLDSLSLLILSGNSSLTR